MSERSIYTSELGLIRILFSTGFDHEFLAMKLLITSVINSYIKHNLTISIPLVDKLQKAS